MASDSEEIEYQAIGKNLFKPAYRQEVAGPNEEDDDDSEISLQEERGFLVHMSPDVNRCKLYLNNYFLPLFVFLCHLVHRTTESLVCHYV